LTRARSCQEPSGSLGRVCADPHVAERPTASAATRATAGSRFGLLLTSVIAHLQVVLRRAPGGTMPPSSELAGGSRSTRPWGSLVGASSGLTVRQSAFHGVLGYPKQRNLKPQSATEAEETTRPLGLLSAGGRALRGRIPAQSPEGQAG
jgi:hypothetical protein